MDKYEYNLKLDEINRLVEEENYEEAARIADTVEWKRVRNARTLCMISEIYEVNGRLEDSKEILLRAYQRSQIGRTILYRLTEVAIKMKEFDEAVEYYSEFVNAAPHDNSRYILKYKIYRGRGSSLEDQISILEEYKEKEYTEKWAYELAKLYKKAGETQKCIEECDDLVLWFRQGPYVIKALELKQTLTTLTPVQQSIYDHKEEVMVEKEDEVEAILPDMEKEILDKMPSNQEEALTENIISETERELAQAVTEHAAQSQEEGWDFDAKAFTSDTKIIPDVTEEAAKTAAGAATAGAAVSAAAGIAAQAAAAVADKMPSPEALQAEPQAAKEANEAAPFDAKNLQQELAKSMHQIVSGLSRKETEAEIIEPMNDQPFLDEAEDYEEEPFMEEKARESAQGGMSIDDILTSMAGVTQEPKEEKVQEAAAVTESDHLQTTAQELEVKEKEEQDSVREAMSQTEDDKPVEPVPIRDITMDLSAVVEAAAGVTHLKPENASQLEKKETAKASLKSEEKPELTQDERYLLSYFSSIQGVPESVAVALYGAKKKIAMDKTSKSGNIVITGLPGSGRTTLGVSIAKALSLEKNEKAARVAKIYADDLNKKDIAATIAKIAGGTLIIEEAGDLEDETVRQLSKAMEFRTDGLIVILEDEKRLLKPVFDHHPEFAEKFTSEVNVPIFTNDELVSFGKTYAYDEDYKIDDMATLALYNRIGELQSPDRPVTVIDVKDIVDRAIRRSERVGFRKLGKILSHKRYDEEDRIILYEKDFK